MAPDLKVWVCPKCKRTFREHVFSEATTMSGPICNACCVQLELAARESWEERGAYSSPAEEGEPMDWQPARFL